MTEQQAATFAQQIAQAHPRVKTEIFHRSSIAGTWSVGVRYETSGHSYNGSPARMGHTYQLDSATQCQMFIANHKDA